ncbi:MAG TPA: DoxX family protein [Bryobacteraceae bacterium]
MQSSQTVPTSKKMLWAGRIVSALVALFLFADSVMKLLKAAPVLEAQTRLGWPESLTLALGITLLACTLAYAIPSTSILGAILMTAYLGGATAAHVRVGEPFYFPIVFGVLVWAGLYMRDGRLRALVPLDGSKS